MKKSPFSSLVSIPAVLLGVALALASAASGDVPRTISYQGYLADDAGDPLTGPVAVTFRLFPEEGPAIWAEPRGTVQLNEGRFAVALGEVTALPADFSQPLYLEIEVNGQTLSPRLPLRSAPYALQAAQAARVDANGVDSAAVADGAIGKAKLAKDVAGAGLAQNGDGSLRIALAGVGSTMIADSAISNQHISATAAIAPSKIGGTAVTLGGSETLTNKTLANPVLTIDDNRFTITDDAYPAYSVQLQLTSPRAEVPTRTLLVPDADGTLALEGYVQNYVGTQMAGLAYVASSGSFFDLPDAPDFARRDEGNVFTAAAGAISLEPLDAAPDAVLLQVIAGQAPVRAGYPGSAVFTVDAEGDVAANSFVGDGAGLTNLASSNLVGTIPFSQVSVGSKAISNPMLANDAFAVTLDTNLTGSTNVALGGTLNLSVNTTNLTQTITGWGLMAAGTQLAVQLSAVATGLTGAGLKDGGSRLEVDTAGLAGWGLTDVDGKFTVNTNELSGNMAGWGLWAGENLLQVDIAVVATALAGTGLVAGDGDLLVDNAQVAPSLAGKGLLHDTFDDTLAVAADNTTIGLDGGGKLAVQSVVSVPIVLDTSIPTVPAHGALVFVDGALQVYNDPDGVGGDPGQWIRIGTYQ